MRTNPSPRLAPTASENNITGFFHGETPALQLEHGASARPPLGLGPGKCAQSPMSLPAPPNTGLPTLQRRVHAAGFGPYPPGRVRSAGGAVPGQQPGCWQGCAIGAERGAKRGGVGPGTGCPASPPRPTSSLGR